MPAPREIRGSIFLQARALRITNPHTAAARAAFVGDATLNLKSDGPHSKKASSDRQLATGAKCTLAARHRQDRGVEAMERREKENSKFQT